MILPSKKPRYLEYAETAKKIWVAFSSSSLKKEEIEKLKQAAEAKPEKKKRSMTTRKKVSI